MIVERKPVVEINFQYLVGLVSTKFNSKECVDNWNGWGNGAYTLDIAVSDALKEIVKERDFSAIDLLKILSNGTSVKPNQIAVDAHRAYYGDGWEGEFLSLAGSILSAEMRITDPDLIAEEKRRWSRYMD